MRALEDPVFEIRNRHEQVFPSFDILTYYLMCTPCVEYIPTVYSDQSNHPNVGKCALQSQGYADGGGFRQLQQYDSLTASLVSLQVNELILLQLVIQQH